MFIAVLVILGESLAYIGNLTSPSHQKDYNFSQSANDVD
jgi:hypothetical protein